MLPSLLGLVLVPMTTVAWARRARIGLRRPAALLAIAALCDLALLRDLRFGGGFGGADPAACTRAVVAWTAWQPLAMATFVVVWRRRLREP